MTATATPPRSLPIRGLGWGAFVSGFVPGLLQYRLGQRGRALLAFVSCTALYFTGWVLVRDRLFAMGLLSFESTAGLPHTLAGLGLPVVLPEMLNLPANAIGSWLSWDATYGAQRAWRLPREMENLGFFLTAASGLLAAFWSADGHFGLRLCRDGARSAPGGPPQVGAGAAPKEGLPAPVCNPALAAGASWLLPGLGHALTGQARKGMLVGAAVLVVFAAGLLASEGHAVDRSIAPVWWIGQVLCGGGALFAALVTAPVEMTSAPPYLDAGTVWCTVAGLMNLVVMIDAFTIAERSVFPLTRPGGAR